MRRIIYSVALFLLFCCSVAFGEILVEHDRFNGHTEITTKPRTLAERPSIILAGIPKEGKKKREVIVISISSSSRDWRYLECHPLFWLVDGERLSLPQPSHEGRIGNGYVIEHLSIKLVPLTQIERLAKAKKVEFKVCNDEFSATEEEMQDFRDFLSKMREHGARK